MTFSRAIPILASLGALALGAPKGPMYVVMRLYWPKDEALTGTWKPSPVVRVQ